MRRAIERGQSLMDSDSILDWVEMQIAQLWLVHDGERPVSAFVTQIDTTIFGSGLNVVALGGVGLDDWLPGVENTIEEFAREKGCVRVQMEGRRGWARELTKFGWRETTVKMIKELK